MTPITEQLTAPVAITAIPPIMTAAQLASILGCQPGTVNDYARDKKLPAIKIAGTWVFTLDTLLPAINQMIEENVRPKAKAIKVPTRRPDLSGY